MKPDDIPEAKRVLNQLQTFALGEANVGATSAVDAMEKVPPEISVAEAQWRRFHSFVDALDKLVSIEEKLKELSKNHGSNPGPGQRAEWREARLGELLPPGAIKEVADYLNRPDATVGGLREILTRYEAELLKKEVLPDYLAYVIWFRVMR